MELLTILKEESGSQEGYVNLTHGRVWYKICGINTAGLPLIVVHGGPGFSHDYLEPLSALSDERPVIFYEQLGCGNSDKCSGTSRWNVDYFGSEFDKVCAALNLKSRHILAHSGAATFVVPSVLSTKCQGVASLVLASPLLSSKRLTEDIKSAVAMLPDDSKMILSTCGNHSESSVKTFTDEQFTEAMTVCYKEFYCRIDPWPDCLNRSLERLNQEIFNTMVGTSIFDFTGNLKDYDITDKLKGLSIPVLVTFGAYEEKFSNTGTYYSSKIPGAKLVIFNNSSHMPHLEQKSEYINCVREFLSAHD
ncbi:MAG: proline iminopeptidase-family hydrolase [Nitrospirae bacterium]|nr:proline iminopeptidase-family hydrolase [Nitrospirota bacterium]MBF0535946.1 proline iminopeptidase-family hydrolase [Nitrospirota bacterium]MBF0618078.1 proline iminopeptidase-family hydrolase [Nitrospirota bacterium]